LSGSTSTEFPRDKKVPIESRVPGPFSFVDFDSPSVLPVVTIPPGAVVVKRSTWAFADAGTTVAAHKAVKESRTFVNLMKVP
jgi:hypothetical protein